jgi:hypothetical protein
MTATSTKNSPCFVTLANHKWFQNLAVAEIIPDTTEGLQMSYQNPTVDLGEIRRKYHAAEREERGGGKQRPKDAKEPN